MKHTVLECNRPAALDAGKHRQGAAAQTGQHQPVTGNSPPDVSLQVSSRVANRKPLVLLMEDDLPVAEMALLLIRRLGVEAVHTGNGSEGLRLARQRIPDAIVTDVDLPGLNGLELCRRLKADVLTAGIPILVWSGNPHHLNAAMAVGASEFLAKPQEAARLSECVRRMLGLGSRKHRHTQLHEDQSEQSSVSLTPSHPQT